MLEVMLRLFAWLASLPFATASKAIQYVLKSSGPARNQPRIIEIGGKRCSVEVIDSSGRRMVTALDGSGSCAVGPTVPDQVLQQMLSNYFARATLDRERRTQASEMAPRPEPTVGDPDRVSQYDAYMMHRDFPQDDEDMRRRRRRRIYRGGAVTSP